MHPSKSPLSPYIPRSPLTSLIVSLSRSPRPITHIPLICALYERRRHYGSSTDGKPWDRRWSNRAVAARSVADRHSVCRVSTVRRKNALSL